MARYFAFVGVAGSARTNAVKMVNTYLSEKGNSVAIIKRIKDIDPFEEAITQSNMEYSGGLSNLVAYISPEGSKALLLGKNHEPQIFQWAEDTVDYILLDGFEDLPDTPKAIFLDLNEPKKPIGVETVAIIGTHEKTRAHSLYKNETELPALVEKLALPPNRNLNCGKCGFPNCKAFRAAVLKGKRTISDCVTYKSPIRLCVNNKDVALVPFVQSLFESIITGMIHPLHISEKEIQTIQITLKRADIP